MAVSIVFGTNDKPVASRELADLMASRDDLSGELFVGYPVVATHAGRQRIDALWASEEAGLVLFDVVEGDALAGYRERQDDSANAVEAHLRSRRALVRREGAQRALLVSVHTVTFAPSVSQLPTDGTPEHPVANADNLVEALQALRPASQGSRKEFEIALSALENTSTIRRSGARRSVEQPDSRGAKLQRLEKSVGRLDAQQARAVIETADGVQRIRGLAGSGKTVVLALKAAYLHAQHPEWRLAVTFHTRSLESYFRQLITDSFVAQTKEMPDWDRLRIVSAWGVPGDKEHDGIYHQFCQVTGATYFDYGRAREELAQAEPFKGACDRALAEAKDVEPSYDAILVDEAQDLPPEFLRICCRLLTPEKRLVYAYDELQNLGREPLPEPSRIFGMGMPRFRHEAAGDIVLRTCYRNSRPVLATAHALGFGINRKPDPGSRTGIVQIFDDAQMWHDLGYQSMSGPIADGKPVVLARPEDASPRFLEDHSNADDLVQFRVFDTDDEQAAWVAEEIERNVRDEELGLNDIVVIDPGPRFTAKAVGPVRALLIDARIQNHVEGVGTEIGMLRAANSVTFTGVHRAKGNEFGMVYVINAHDCYAAEHSLAAIRNRLFAAITRSKAWVRVCGVGEEMRRLSSEYAKLKQSDYELRFIYPTEHERQQMRGFHREKSDVDIKRLDIVSNLVEDLQAGRAYPEDFGEMGSKLQELLLVREGRRNRGDS